MAEERHLLGTNRCSHSEGCDAVSEVHKLIKVDKHNRAHCVLLCMEHAKTYEHVVAQAIHWVRPDCDMPGARWYNDGCRSCPE